MKKTSRRLADDHGEDVSLISTTVETAQPLAAETRERINRRCALLDQFTLHPEAAWPHDHAVQCSTRRRSGAVEAPGFGESVEMSRGRPPITVLMPFKHNSFNLSCLNEKKPIVKFKPFTTKEKDTWLNCGSNRGFIRVYDPNAKEFLISQKNPKSPSVVVPCTVETSCKQICEKLAIQENELHVTLNGDTVRRLDPSDKPLLIQNGYLSTIGLTDTKRQQECGDSLDLCFLIKFSAGRPMINDEFGRSTLSSCCHVRKGRVFHQWTKRLCVLNSARLLVYPDLDRSGTPDVIALSRAKVEDVHLRSRGRCIKITVAAPRRPVQTFYIGFESAVDLNIWLSRCLKGSAKVPPISDLSNLQLEYLPEQVFCIGSERLLTQLNLRRNCLKNRPDNENSFTIGWLDDLPRLESLRSLNLADNDLRVCPSALFQLSALTELILTGNKLSELPCGIGKLCNLQTLNLQNNWLSRLPVELIECQSLCNIDLSFNRFAKIPETLHRLQLVEQWILNGNDIEKIVDESILKNAGGIKKIELRRCKLVQNASAQLPNGLFSLLTHLDIRDNRFVTSLDLKSLHSLQVLSCQRCSLYDLQLNGSALTCLFASKNNLRSLVVMPVPKQLKVFDVSHNNLNKLPEWLTELGKIEKIVASHNRLTTLPHRIFTNVSSIKTLILNHNSISNLPNQVENCFIELLDLHHNKLTQLPPEFLASAHKLRVLNVSENLLTTLPPLNPFLDLNKVQQLYLACNRLMDDVISIISGYRRLRVLDLAYNVIKSVDDSCIEKLQLLESINLSGNRLQHLPRSVASLQNLVVLRSHSNRLITLPDFSRAPCLKVLDCGSNQLEMVDVRHLLSPQLKHLDVSCNPRLRLDTSAFQQFRSERLVSLIDMSRESRTAFSQPTDRAKNADKSQTSERPPWQTGFSETSGERNKLCISQLRLSSFRKEGLRNGALFGIMDGGLNNELPQQLTSKFPEILHAERMRDQATDQYMKHTLIAAHQSLQTSGQKMGASCTLCHIEEGAKETKSYTLRIANVGHTEAVLCRKGKAFPLTKRFLVEDAPVEEMERIKTAGAIVTEENEVNGITPCSRLLGCNFLYPAVVPCPHVMSIELQSNDEFILIASRGLWEIMDHTEAVRRIRRISNPILAAKHLQDVAQAYGFKVNLSIVVVRFLFNGSPRRDADVGAIRATPRQTLPAVMSAIDVADSDDEYSLTSDDDVKSEPRDTKLIREPPNYYFEYKKQLKQLMLEAGSSDAFSVDDGPESLYSIATLVHDQDFDQSIDNRPRPDEASRLDDGYQSSDVATPRATLVHFRQTPYVDNGGYASLANKGENRSIRNDQNDQGDGSGSQRSASSSCSSGLGKSSSTSPDQRPDARIIDNPVPRWRIDDQEALQDAKERFQEARRSIISKLGRDPKANTPQPHLAKICILGQEQIGSERKSSNDENSIDASIYEIPSSYLSRKQSIYEKISHDDNELSDERKSPDFPIWRYPLNAAHSDDQIQCAGNWDQHQKKIPTPIFDRPDRSGSLDKSMGKPPKLVVANIDIDGTGPQNVIICDHDMYTTDNQL